jgi:hypothetical protein
MFYLATPSGSCYFKGPGTKIVDANQGFEITESSYPPYKGDTKGEKTDADMVDYDWDEGRMNAQYRVSRNKQILVPFLTSFAKALSCMPNLKKATLWSSIQRELYPCVSRLRC